MKLTICITIGVFLGNFLYSLAQIPLINFCDTTAGSKICMLAEVQ